MGKKESKSKSKTLDSELTSTESTSTVEESPKPTPKPTFNGPLIELKNIDVKAGGVVSVTCLDDKVPLGKIQYIQIKTRDASYVYRRIQG